MTFISLAPIIISLLVFTFSIFTFLRQEKINRLTLKKLEKEEEQEKCARIEANVIKHEKGRRDIKVYNKGKAIARNVVVTFPENPNFLKSDYPSPIDILPQHSLEIRTTVFMGSPKIIKIVFEWDDKNKSNNRGSQVLQLH